MPRTSRASAGNVCYHVLNRGNARNEVFHKDGDYGSFLKLLNQAEKRVSMRLLGFCLMPNHFHLVLWPRQDGDLSTYMQWLMTSHVRRYHRHYDSSGHVWQGRFKAFPVESDEHLLTVLRYVERNPVRGASIPVRKAEKWPWSSAGTPSNEFERVKIHPGPVPKGEGWLDWVNRPLNSLELEAMRNCVARGKPFGGPKWEKKIVAKLGLESTLRPRGRPRKKKK